MSGLRISRLSLISKSGNYIVVDLLNILPHLLVFTKRSNYVSFFLVFEDEDYLLGVLGVDDRNRFLFKLGIV
jgi:hypothetical protein